MTERQMDYSVIWSIEDQEWVATTALCPSLSWLAHSPQSALNGLIELLDEEMLL